MNGILLLPLVVVLSSLNLPLRAITSICHVFAELDQLFLALGATDIARSISQVKSNTQQPSCFTRISNFINTLT